MWAAELVKILADYLKRFGFGYEHRGYIHVHAGHKFHDNSPSAKSYVLDDPAKFAARGGKILDDFLAAFKDMANNENNIIQAFSYLPPKDDDFNKTVSDIVIGKYKLKVKQVTPDAIAYVSQFRHNPFHEKKVWELATRENDKMSDSFYWLQADLLLTKG